MIINPSLDDMNASEKLNYQRKKKLARMGELTDISSRDLSRLGHCDVWECLISEAKNAVSEAKCSRKF